ncbi:helix-turn-helix transcriptional regulator [Clostridium gasigenes]|uniref:helix-turn-helix domain-containing protein n=1 Tax=Clostridium gasigenes TaxID=94869 RepID=UPI0016255205|nr:helix-turn-helix transcriptional regulator [Clostridium gasigenes]MBB6622181.1 helix-turn-helix transcriptional regulator [Clostridium gasigenes]
MNIGIAIKNNRKKIGITQLQLAERLDISKHTLAKYEQNQRTPNIFMLEKISSIFDKPVTEFTGKGKIFTGEMELVDTHERALESINNLLSYISNSDKFELDCFSLIGNESEILLDMLCENTLSFLKMANSFPMEQRILNAIEGDDDGKKEE